MSARETLAGMRAIEQAATEGPWPGGPCQEARSDESILFDGRGEALVYGLFDADADFITAARTFVPKALAALDAVLALIRARTRTPAEDGSVDEYDYVGELADDILAAIEQALS